MTRGGGDGKVEGAGRADSFLDKIGETPTAPDVGCVLRCGDSNTGGVVD